MSDKSVTVTIEICTNCKSHAWCTRHDEKKYEGIFEEIRKAVNAKDPEVNVVKQLATEKKMGAFEITSNSKLLFSKLASTFFPNTHAITDKIISFVGDLRSGKDVASYDITHESHHLKEDQKYYNSFVEPRSPNNQRQHSGKKLALHESYAEHKDRK